jgi:hypothetical protein
VCPLVSLVSPVQFDIEDEKSTKATATFFMDEGEKQKQIGDECEYLLPVLTKGKPVFKGLIVPGGQVNMMWTARYVFTCMVRNCALNHSAQHF